MPQLQSNGIRVYYEEQGSGEPLLLIMGFTVSSIGWHWNIPGFARHFRTIAFDNRGVGRSDKPDVPYSMAMFADDTVGVLDALGIERAHVFGISIGRYDRTRVHSALPAASKNLHSRLHKLWRTKGRAIQRS